MSPPYRTRRIAWGRPQFVPCSFKRALPRSKPTRGRRLCGQMTRGTFHLLDGTRKLGPRPLFSEMRWFAACSGSPPPWSSLCRPLTRSGRSESTSPRVSHRHRRKCVASGWTASVPTVSQRRPTAPLPFGIVRLTLASFSGRTRTSDRSLLELPWIPLGQSMIGRAGAISLRSRSNSARQPRGRIPSRPESHGSAVRVSRSS